MDLRNRFFMIIPGTIATMILVSVLLFNVSGIFSSPSLAVAAAPETIETTNTVPAASDLYQKSRSEKGAECAVSSSYPETILQWCTLITYYSEQRSLAPDLVAALIWQESGGDHLAYSQSGAVGLMQVMPRDGLAAGFNCVNGPCFASRPTTAELEDPEFNINFGTKYLAQQVARQGDLRSGLKAYGPMDVGFYYADKVLGIYETYREQD